MPNCASSARLVGASSPIPPIWIAIEPKFAKPQRAKLAMVKAFGVKTSFKAAKSVYAIN